MSSSSKSLIDTVPFGADLLSIVIDNDLAENILLESRVDDLFDFERLSELVSGLRELYAIAMVEAGRAPQATRTEVNLLLRKLSARKTPLAEILADPFASAVMYPAWIDLHAINLGHKLDAGFLSREFDGLHRFPSKLAALVRHFKSRIDEFDKLTKKEQSDWYFNAGSKAEVASRQMLYPFLQSGIPTTAETYIVRNIAALYEIATGSNFSVTSVDHGAVYEARYTGPGIRFGCAVCRALSLSAFMAFSKTRPVNPYRPKGQEARYLDPKTQRYLHPIGEANDTSVANAIGDNWKNDRKRAGPKPLSIYG